MEKRRGLRYSDIPKHRNDLLDLTSLTVNEFEVLVPTFEEEFLRYMQSWTLEGTPRSANARPFQVYNNCPLPAPEDRLLFILTYLKGGMIQIFHAYLFAMKQPQTCTWIRTLLNVLKETLRRTGDAPARSASELAVKMEKYIQNNPHIIRAQISSEATSQDNLASDVSSTSQALPPSEQTPPTTQPQANEPLPQPAAPIARPEKSKDKKEVFSHDGTERPRSRPVRDQKNFYSGKKKRHCVKNLVLINAALIILFLSPTVSGKMHDKALADQVNYALPSGSELLQDTGFQGLKIENVTITQPMKKPRGGELTTEQKLNNQKISRRRVRIEHVNSSIKRCRIITSITTALADDHLDSLMEVCCGLHNFRLRISPTWTPMI